MDKGFSNQLWVGDGQFYPAQNPQASPLLGSSGSHISSCPILAPSGHQVPGLTWKRGPREAYFSLRIIELTAACPPTHELACPVSQGQ